MAELAQRWVTPVEGMFTPFITLAVGYRSLCWMKSLGLKKQGLKLGAAGMLMPLPAGRTVCVECESM